MLGYMVKNRALARVKRSWVIFSLAALTLCAGCSRSEEFEGEEAAGNRLSIESVDVASVADWMTRSQGSSESESEDKAATFVKLGDSLILYARVEPLGVDTTQVLTRGTPVMSINDLSDMRINLYNSANSNWTPSTAVTEAIRVSRSGKVYVTSPSFSWQSRTDKVTLLTYTPLPTSANGLTEGANGNTVKYTVPTDVTKQPDFCATFADKDLVNSEGTRHVRDLIFYHRLTAVGFALNGWNVKVNKVEISGVSFSGTYDLGSSTWSGNTTVGSDSRLLGVNSTKVPTDYYNPNTNWTDVTRSNGYLMMVPQTLTDKAQAKITYTDAAGKEQTMLALLSEMTAGKWEAGDKITYCIQLETAPSIGTDPVTLYMPWKAGYTTTTKIPFVVCDPQDRYTFTWAEPWNVIHRGQAKVNNIDGGASSGWYTAATNTTPIWFFTKVDNSSISSSRSSVVTLDAWRTADRTFNVVQGMKPYLVVEGMPPVRDDIPKEGKTVTVTVKSNYPWESVLSNMKLTPSSGEANMTGQRVEVVIPPGDGSEGAISAVFKTTNDNKVPDLIATASYQYGREIIFSINPTTPGSNVPGAGEQYRVNVISISGMEWTTRPSAGVTVVASGKGSGTITITVGANPSKTTARDVKVDFLVDGIVRATWSGRQLLFPDYISLTDDEKDSPILISMKSLQTAYFSNWSRLTNTNDPETMNQFDGKSNTDVLMGRPDPNDYRAAKSCRNLGEDWYLPASAELAMTWIYSGAIPDSEISTNCWSSTQCLPPGYFQYAYTFNMTYGLRIGSKYNTFLVVRCAKVLPSN